jgi:hypothetical protein
VGYRGGEGERRGKGQCLIREEGGAPTPTIIAELVPWEYGWILNNGEEWIDPFFYWIFFKINSQNPLPVSNFFRKSSAVEDFKSAPTLLLKCLVFRPNGFEEWLLGGNRRPPGPKLQPSPAEQQQTLIIEMNNLQYFLFSSMAQFWLAFLPPSCKHPSLKFKMVSHIPPKSQE